MNISITSKRQKPQKCAKNLHKYTTTHYITDPSYSNAVITAGNSQFVDVGFFAHYFRLQYNLDTFTATFSAFYNVQA